MQKTKVEFAEIIRSKTTNKNCLTSSDASSMKVLSSEDSSINLVQAAVFRR